MNPRSLRVGQALDLLPDLAEMQPLREALVVGSVEDPSRRWAGSEAYRTLEARITDLDSLEARLPDLVRLHAEGVERIWGAVLRATRAVEANRLSDAARALVEAGEAEESAGRLEAAEAFYERAREVGRRPRDRAAEGLALRRLGRIAKARGDLRAGIERYLHGFEIADAEGDTTGAVVACQGLGNCYVDEGNWSEAERWYRLGLDRVGQQPSVERWQLESNLSIVARRAGRMDEAVAWLIDARKTAAVSGPPASQVYLSNAEGMLLVEMGRLAEAETAYRAALDAATTPAEEATVLINLGECLLLQGRNEESVETVRRLERLAIANGLDAYLIHVYLGLGAAAREAGDPDAIVFYEQALDLSRQAPRADRALVLREYARHDARQGAVEAAAARLREAAALYEAGGSTAEREAVERELRELEYTSSDEAQI